MDAHLDAMIVASLTCNRVIVELDIAISADTLNMTRAIMPPLEISYMKLAAFTADRRPLRLSLAWYRAEHAICKAPW